MDIILAFIDKELLISRDFKLGASRKMSGSRELILFWADLLDYNLHSGVKGFQMQSCGFTSLWKVYSCALYYCINTQI